MRGSKWKQCTCLLLCILMGLSGCSKSETIEAPILLEPIATMEYYAPVERGMVGKQKTLMGTVVHKTYDQFFQSSSELKTIYPSIGDYVHTGDLIAEAMSSETEQKLGALQKSLQSEEKQFEKQKSDTERQIATLSKYLSAENNIEISILRENLYYEEQLHEGRVASIKEQIAEAEKESSETKLYAKQDGVVVYKKAINSYFTSYAMANEGVLRLESDEFVLKVNDLHNSNKTAYKDKVLSVFVNGEQIEAQIVPYSNQELVSAQLLSYDPPIYMTFDGIENLSAGDTVIIYAVDPNVTECMRVEKASLYGDTDAEYVYIKDPISGEKTQVSVVVGRRDEHYVEILSGVSVGDQVLCASTRLLPNETNTYCVKAQNYDVMNHTMKVSKAYDEYYTVKSDYEGVIVDVDEKLLSNDMIEKGDYLYQIQTHSKGAALLEAKYALEDAVSARNDEEALYTKQLAEYNKMLGMAVGNAEWTAELLAQIQTLNESHAETVEVLDQAVTTAKDKEEKLSKNNDGQGLITVYAETSGSVMECYLRNGFTVSENSPVYSVGVEKEHTLYVEMESYRDIGESEYFNDAAKPCVGMTVKFTSVGKLFEGVCIGYDANYATDDMKNLYSDETVSCVTYIENMNRFSANFLVRMPDDVDLDEVIRSRCVITYPYIYAKDVIVLPPELLQTDHTPSAKGYFVWKMVDGEPKKQYVTIEDQYQKYTRSVIVVDGLKEGDELCYGL